MADDISRRSILRAGTAATPLAVSGCLGELVMNEYGDGGGGDTATNREGQTSDVDTGNETSTTDEGSEDTELDTDDDVGQENDPGAAIEADATSNYAVYQGTAYVETRIEDEGDADYFDVEFSGDASAKGRMFQRGDVLRLKSFDLVAIQHAEDLTPWHGSAFNGASVGDEITTTVTAVKDGVRTVVHERTNVLGPTDIDADLRYLYDKSNNRVRVILRDPGRADYVHVRFRRGGGGDIVTGRLENPGDEIVIGSLSTDDRPIDKHSNQLYSQVVGIEQGSGLGSIQGHPTVFDTEYVNRIKSNTQLDGDDSIHYEEKMDDQRISGRIFVPGIETYGQARVFVTEDQADSIVDAFTDADERWIGDDTQITIEGTAVMEGENERNDFTSEVLYVTDSLSERQEEVEP